MATFVEKRLGGAGFFETIRTTMANTGEWLFAGSDGHLRYVVMDALFYGMETVIRPDGSTNLDYNPDHLLAQRFTDYASNLTAQSTIIPRFRVVVNGNFYDNGDFNYFFPGPNHWWKGEVYQAGRHIQPPEKSADAKPLADISFIGRNGQRIDRYRCEADVTPSQYKDSHPGFTPTYAMGGVKRIMADKWLSPDLDTSEARWRGKTIVGFHNATGSLFVVSQQDVKSFQGNLTSIVLFGSDLADIVRALLEARVDAAIKCDGGTSSALIVDGDVVVWCDRLQRNCSTPNGLAFKFARILLGGQDTQATIDHGRQNVSNFHAAIAVEPSSGRLILTITSLGSTPLDGDIASSLSIQLSPNFPLVLRAPLGSDLRNGAAFTSISFPPSSVECFAGLHADPNVDAIAATLRVMQGTTVLKTGSFVLPIMG